MTTWLAIAAGALAVVGWASSGVLWRRLRSAERHEETALAALRTAVEDLEVAARAVEDLEQRLRLERAQRQRERTALESRVSECRSQLDDALERSLGDGATRDEALRAIDEMMAELLGGTVEVRRP